MFDDFDIDDFMIWVGGIFAILFFVGLPVWTFFVADIGGTMGEHTGYVTAVEFSQPITWSANLVYFKTDTESTQEDIYCVNDKHTMQELKEAQKSKRLITIKYENDFIMLRSECNGGESIIVDVENINMEEVLK